MPEKDNTERSEPESVEALATTPCSAPYILRERVVVDRLYNPKYGDDRICECGHPYYRHFDSYENMEACGCKYCGCYEFVEQNSVDI